MKSLGPIEVYCDSPPYFIVTACHMIGLRRPEDVRWIGLRSFLAEVIDPQTINKRLKGLYCSCGQAMPKIMLYHFTTQQGQFFEYLLGQCEKCQTVFWERKP